MHFKLIKNVLFSNLLKMLKISLLNCHFKTKNILYKIRVQIHFRFGSKNIKRKRIMGEK